MKKYPIGFNTSINNEDEYHLPMEVCKGVIEPKKSVVQVYFPHRGMGWAYYNDTFDLKVGDFVYVEGSENYEIEFNYIDGEISNLKCSCFCSGACKHEFAAMLQLKEALELIGENYEDEYNEYFAIISKVEFVNMVMSKKTSGKIRMYCI